MTNKKWIEFKNFYIKKLLAVDVNDEQARLAANNDILQANMATVDDQLEDLRSRIDAVPSMINTDTTTADTTLGTGVSRRELAAYQAKLERTISDSIANTVADAFKKNNRTDDGNNRGRRTTRGTWRQYAWWCHSCGTNGRGCTSKTCRRRKPGHKENATYEDQQGGSPRLLERWMEWLGPDDRHYKNKSDYTGPN